MHNNNTIKKVNLKTVLLIKYIYKCIYLLIESYTP